MPGEARAFYEAAAPSYDERHAGPWAAHLRRRERALLARYAGGTVIDIGCGTGTHLRPGWAGMDVARGMLLQARGRGMLVQGDERLPFRDASADTVLCLFSVLNLAPALPAELVRILQPGGRLLLSFATPRDARGQRERVLSSHGRRARLRLFTLREAEALFPACRVLARAGLFSAVRPRWGAWDMRWHERLRLAADRLLPAGRAAMALLVLERLPAQEARSPPPGPPL
ncbi:MAG: methyltransferase domain-containing protein [Candidatus Aenigmarchaeota archaeon]|nr:methyltransferase domain-containing protein [Candidatus Aenigmarchaeota archaeon]